MSPPSDGRQDPELRQLPVPRPDPEQRQLPAQISTYTALSAPNIQGRQRGDRSPSSPGEQNAAVNGQGHAPNSKPATRICRKCGQSFTGQYVRALGGAFHLDCFKCRDCGVTVASKFFPVDDERGEGQYPLCETDYFRRLDLICHSCGGALRGSYITALERKYHIEHFTCCVCPTVFGPQDSYYEHDSRVYCHYHYSTQFAAKCNGCQTAILKQFVEIFRNGQNQHWHPECYMIHKFWNVRLAPGETAPPQSPVLGDPSQQRRSLVREAEENMEEKVYRIWSVLSAFEESSAACISDMLLHVSNGAYVDGVFVSERFIWHVEILFNSADILDAQLTQVGGKGLAYSREAKLLCKKIVAFFTLLSKTQETGVRKLGVTQELLSLVTGLAHYLKLLIRISLQGALKLEQTHNNSLSLGKFLEKLSDLEAIREGKQSLELTQVMSANLADITSDVCTTCAMTIEDECAKYGDRRWHLPCLTCANCLRELKAHPGDGVWMDSETRILCKTCASNAQGPRHELEHVTKLKQYVYLLRVALARLLLMLRQGGTLPHTSDDPNLSTYDSSSGQKAEGTGPPLLQLASRSKSYNGEQSEAYKNTVNDIKRLRSTRLEGKTLGNSARKARQSRIIEGPEADSVRPGSPGNGPSPGPQNNNRRESTFRIIEDKDFNGENAGGLTFGDDKVLTLDDIPRIVAAEQAREQRPNAYKHQRAATSGSHPLSPGQPRLVNGHQHDLAHDKDRSAPLIPQPAPPRAKRYFSELSALEYFNVRHLAVFSMEPLVNKYFNLEELLGLIETRKVNFWGRFGKAFGKNNPGGNVGKAGKKKEGVFGMPLDVLVERDGADSSMGVGPNPLRIPGIIDEALVAMRQMDMSVEGVFRKNGNIRRLKDIAERIDQGAENIEMIPEGPVQIAALLKKFLRELPDPLLTFKLHRLFITSSKIKDEDTRRRVLHLTCCLLPKSHRDSMEILFTFLNWAASFSHVDEDFGSKMDIHNLATVISPNILRTKESKEGQPEETTFLAIEAINTLIEYNEQMCEVPEDLLSMLNDSNLFAGSADLTTKDILKRYGEIVNRPTPARTIGPPNPPQTTDSPPPKSKEGRGSAPIYHRVDADGDTSNTAWQREPSVKHIQGPPQPSSANPTDGGNREFQRQHTRGNSDSSQFSDQGNAGTNGNGNGNGNGSGNGIGNGSGSGNGIGNGTGAAGGGNNYGPVSNSNNNEQAQRNSHWGNRQPPPPPPPPSIGQQQHLDNLI
ncbi:hypothetical protein DFH27DRAFT_153739 [Peziza echinospora]|nr:hypothetical protein DFH27DRAFT_153739 [Peziza echinospora]